MCNPPQRTRWGRLFAWVIGGLIFTQLLLSGWPQWAPDWVVRIKQRQKLHERVEVAGGWAAVQRDCDALAAQHLAPGWYWPNTAKTPPLPPTLAALNPRGVYYMPRGPTREEDPEPQMPIFRMKFFGGRNTGGGRHAVLRVGGRGWPQLQDVSTPLWWEHRWQLPPRDRQDLRGLLTAV